MFLPRLLRQAGPRRPRPLFVETHFLFLFLFSLAVFSQPNASPSFPMSCERFSTLVVSPETRIQSYSGPATFFIGDICSLSRGPPFFDPDLPVLDYPSVFVKVDMGGSNVIPLNNMDGTPSVFEVVEPGQHVLFTWNNVAELGGGTGGDTSLHFILDPTAINPKITQEGETRIWCGWTIFVNVSVLPDSCERCPESVRKPPSPILAPAKGPAPFVRSPLISPSSQYDILAPRPKSIPTPCDRFKELLFSGPIQNTVLGTVLYVGDVCSRVLQPSQFLREGNLSSFGQPAVIIASHQGLLSLANSDGALPEYKIISQGQHVHFHWKNVSELAPGLGATSVHFLFDPSASNPMILNASEARFLSEWTIYIKWNLLPESCSACLDPKSDSTWLLITIFALSGALFVAIIVAIVLLVKLIQQRSKRKRWPLGFETLPYVPLVKPNRPYPMPSLIQTIKLLPKSESRMDMFTDDSDTNFEALEHSSSSSESLVSTTS